MTDPFDALRSPVAPMSPDPEFTADLRRRLERAVGLPKGVAVSDVQLEEPTQNTATASNLPRSGALPYLAVNDARGAIAWYVDVLGATAKGEPVVMDDDRIGHAELAIGDGSIYLSDDYPEMGVTAPSGSESSVSLMIPVEDTDAVLQRARDAGARVTREASDAYGGRGATFIDPFGHRWMLYQPLGVAAEWSQDGVREGDIVYVSWFTEDIDLAALFYGEVLGWELATADPGRSRQVINVESNVGVEGGHTRSTLFCVYAVRDISAAVDQVRQLGGSAQDPVDTPHGTTADCVDNQGVAFALHQTEAGQPRPALNGSRPGDLTYITAETPSSAAYREFYGGVLGWTFEEGRVEDGWGPVDVAPMFGLVGGGTGVVVPMWTVRNLEEAVRRVESAGGRVLQPPTEQSYGGMAECVDNQGARFYLGTL